MATRKNRKNIRRRSRVNRRKKGGGDENSPKKNLINIFKDIVVDNRPASAPAATPASAPAAASMSDSTPMSAQTPASPPRQAAAAANQNLKRRFNLDSASTSASDIDVDNLVNELDSTNLTESESKSKKMRTNGGKKKRRTRRTKRTKKIRRKKGGGPKSNKRKATTDSDNPLAYRGDPRVYILRIYKINSLIIQDIKAINADIINVKNVFEKIKKVYDYKTESDTNLDPFITEGEKFLNQVIYYKNRFIKYSRRIDNIINYVMKKYNTNDLVVELNELSSKRLENVNNLEKKISEFSEYSLRDDEIFTGKVDKNYSTVFNSLINEIIELINSTIRQNNDNIKNKLEDSKIIKLIQGLLDKTEFTDMIILDVEDLTDKKGKRIKYIDNSAGSSREHSHNY